jgi:hypothetical protein
MQSQPSPRPSTSPKVSRVMLRLDRKEWDLALKECSVCSGFAVGKTVFAVPENRGLVGFISELKPSHELSIRGESSGSCDCYVVFTTEPPHKVAHRIANMLQPKLSQGRRLAILALSLNESQEWFGMVVTKLSKNPLEGYVISSEEGGDEVIVTRNRRKNSEGVHEKLKDCSVAIFGIDSEIALPIANCMLAGEIKHLRLFDNRVITTEMQQKTPSLSPLARGRARSEQFAKMLMEGSRDRLISYLPMSAWEIANQNHHVGLNSLLICCDGQPSDRSAVVKLALEHYLVPMIDIAVVCGKHRGEDVVTADVRLLMPGTACDSCQIQMMKGDWNYEPVTVTLVNLVNMSRSAPDFLAVAKEQIQKAAVGVALQFWYEMINGDVHESRWTRLEIIAGEDEMRKLDMVGQESSGDCGHCNFTAA